MLRCMRCGNIDTFLASQSCRGTVTVKVDRKGSFVTNLGPDGCLDTDGLDFDDPEGPYACERCGESDDVVDLPDG